MQNYNEKIVSVESNEDNIDINFMLSPSVYYMETDNERFEVIIQLLTISFMEDLYGKRNDFDTKSFRYY